MLSEKSEKISICVTSRTVYDWCFFGWNQFSVLHSRRRAVTRRSKTMISRRQSEKYISRHNVPFSETIFFTEKAIRREMCRLQMNWRDIDVWTGVSRFCFGEFELKQASKKFPLDIFFFINFLSLNFSNTNIDSIWRAAENKSTSGIWMSQLIVWWRRGRSSAHICTEFSHFLSQHRRKLWSSWECKGFEENLIQLRSLWAKFFPETFCWTKEFGPSCNQTKAHDCKLCLNEIRCAFGFIQIYSHWDARMLFI